jgi:hypothetical protein
MLDRVGELWQHDLEGLRLDRIGRQHQRCERFSATSCGEQEVGELLAGHLAALLFIRPEIGGHLIARQIFDLANARPEEQRRGRPAALPQEFDRQGRR